VTPEINRFYLVDGEILHYIGPIQGWHVFEGVTGEWVTFAEIPTQLEPFDS
jgi:hypothetical protein